MAFLFFGPNNNEFSLTADHCTGRTLANGATCTVAVQFAPMSTGIKHASLQVTIPGGDSAGLTGTGQ